MTNISSELKTQRYPDHSTGKAGMEGCILSDQPVFERMPEPSQRNLLLHPSSRNRQAVASR